MSPSLHGPEWMFIYKQNTNYIRELIWRGWGGGENGQDRLGIVCLIHFYIKIKDYGSGTQHNIIIIAHLIK